MLGKLYEQALERNKQQYGASDARTLQAARDLGLFLSKHGRVECPTIIAGTFCITRSSFCSANKFFFYFYFNRLFKETNIY